MAWLYVVSTNDPETVYNAVRLANVSLDNKKEVNLFISLSEASASNPVVKRDPLPVRWAS